MFVYLMVAFSLFWFSVYWYGIFYLLGFIWFYLFLFRLSRQQFLKQYPSLQKVLQYSREDLLLFSLFGVLLGWRLGYVLIYEFDYYLAHPWKIFAVHEWGMAFIWWIIGVCLALFIFIHVNAYGKKLSMRSLLFLFDSIVVVLPLAIILWRFGNYLNQEIYWILVNSDFYASYFGKILSSCNIIHRYSQIDNLPRFNTNFLAIIFEGFVLFFILGGIFLRDIKKHMFSPGKLSGIFLIGYSFFRFFIEYLRQDSQAEFVYWLTKSQWFFLLFFIVGVLLLWYAMQNISFKENLKGKLR